MGEPAMRVALSAEEERAIALGALVTRAMDPATAAAELLQIERRNRARHTAYAVSVMLLAAGGLVFVTQTSPRPAHMALADGTTVHALSNDLDLVLRETPTATLFELERGSGRFDVARRDRRPVRVRAGAVVVEVLGTRFDVQRTPKAVAVAVLSGRVRVRAPAGQVVLEAGARSVFSLELTPAERAPAMSVPSAADAALSMASTPPDMTQPPDVTQSPDVPASDAPMAACSTPPRTRVVSAGLKVLPTGVRGVDALLLGADAARRAGDRQAALAHLNAILRRHPEDARAAAAAFTIGRLSHEPKAAAEAFDQAFRLAPGGAMANDALARAAEAWQRAGESDRAKARAKQALERAPNGRGAARLQAILAQ
ncbi:MAG: TolA-binding protein [Bradymonadia bacterium]|jgi:TolA-binding protein